MEQSKQGNRNNSADLKKKKINLSTMWNKYLLVLSKTKIRRKKYALAGSLRRLIISQMDIHAMYIICIDNSGTFFI